MLPKYWQPIITENLIRVGSKFDGGYIIPKIILEKTTLLFGLGVSTDWTFEEEFRKLSKCKVICYDHSITKAFWKRKFHKDVKQIIINKKINFKILKELFKYIDYKLFFNGRTTIHEEKMVGSKSNEQESIENIIGNIDNESIFLKSDIEGSEYEILDELIEYQNKLLGIVIEFHSIDQNRDKIDQFIQNFDQFSIVHFHANNWGGVDQAGDPKVVEITFLNNQLLEPSTSGANKTRTYPVQNLDYPNNPDRADITLNFSQC